MSTRRRKTTVTNIEPVTSGDTQNSVPTGVTVSQKIEVTISNTTTGREKEILKVFVDDDGDVHIENETRYDSLFIDRKNLNGLIYALQRIRDAV